MVADDFVAGDISKTVHERLDAIEAWILDKTGQSKKDAEVDVPVSVVPGIADENAQTATSATTVAPSTSESVKL